MNKVFYSYNIHTRKWHILKYIEMSIFRNYIFCIRLYGTIHELIIIRIVFYQFKMIIYFDMFYIVSIQYCRNNIYRDFT